MDVRRYAAAVLLGVLLCAAPPARAQDDPNTVRARELFGEGVDFMSQRNYAAAAERFRAALELRDAPAVRYNLGSALMELDQDGEAYDLMRSVADDADATRDLVRNARTALQRLEPEVGFIVIRTSGSAEVEVSIGGRAIPPDRLGTPVAVSPGSHVIVARAGEREVARASMTVAAGETVEAQLGASADTEEAVERPPVVDIEPEPEDDGGRSIAGDWRFWTAVGAGVVAVVLIVVLVATLGGGVQSPVRGNFNPTVLEWR